MTAAKSQAADETQRLFPLVAITALLCAILWAYWNTMIEVIAHWDNPRYSHGYLVPLFTLVLLWLRRDQRAPVNTNLAYLGGGLLGVSALLFGVSAYAETSRDIIELCELIGAMFGVCGAMLIVQPQLPSTVSSSARWSGLGLIAAGLALRLACTWMDVTSLRMYSLLPVVIGLFLLLGDWVTFRWSAAPLAYLFFMFPLPGFLDRGVLVPLQRIATEASTFGLQTLGVPAINEGNNISMGSDLDMEVVEACSGLRMLTITLAIAVSAIPIALAVNIIRITSTGIAYQLVGKEATEHFFHDLAGWVMMPLALGLLYLEFQILSHLFIEEEGLAGPLPMAGARTVKTPAGTATR